MESFKRLSQLPDALLYAAQSRQYNVERYGNPKAWKSRLSCMVQGGIISEVMDLVEALAGTSLALSAPEAIGMLAMAYVNAAAGSYHLYWYHMRENQIELAAADLEVAAADEQHAAVLNTASDQGTEEELLAQILHTRAAEREGGNPYLELRDNRLWSG